MEIKFYRRTGNFAGNKDLAKEIRTKEIIPALNKGKEIILNFKGIESTTQSFIHALISDVIRKEGIGILKKISFKNCNSIIKKIIRIVTEYMQETN